MNLVLHVEAATVEELVAKAAAALGFHTNEDHQEHQEDRQIATYAQALGGQANGPDAAGEAAAGAVGASAVEPKKRTRKTKETAAQISTGGERHAPDDDDIPEASAEAVREAHDAYIEKYGVEAAMKDIPAMLTTIAGKPVQRVSEIADVDGKVLGRIVAITNEALAKNPFKRSIAGSTFQ